MFRLHPSQLFASVVLLWNPIPGEIWVRDRGYHQHKFDLFHSLFSCCANLKMTMYLGLQVYPTTHRWSETTQLQRQTCAQVVPHGNLNHQRCGEDKLKNLLPYFHKTRRMTSQDTHQGCNVFQMCPRCRQLFETCPRRRHMSETSPRCRHVSETSPRHRHLCPRQAPDTATCVRDKPQTPPCVRDKPQEAL